MIMLRLFFLLQHSTGAFANRICGKRFLIRIKQSKNGTSCELSADGRGLCDNRELGHEEVFDCACRRGAVWRRCGRNGKFGRRTLGLGLRWLARCLGLWWLGLPRRRMLRRLGLSRLGLGTGGFAAGAVIGATLATPYYYYPVPAYPAYYYYSYPAPAYYYYGAGSGCCY